MGLEIIKKENKINLNYDKSVVFGVPESTNNREPMYVTKTKKGKNGRVYTRKELVAGGMNNAEILALMEAGSPAKSIPSRKLLEPVKNKYQAKIDEYFGKIFEALLNNDKAKADSLMEELALRMETWTKKFFTDSDNNWKPNAPSTIKKKGSDKPLIDTGSLRQSIRGAVIRGKNK